VSNAKFRPVRQLQGRGTEMTNSSIHPKFNGFMTVDPACQFCGGPGWLNFMIRNGLWELVIGKPYAYGSGYACLGCVAARLSPRQLRNEDFTGLDRQSIDKWFLQNADGSFSAIDDDHPSINRRHHKGDVVYCGEVIYKIIFPPEDGDTVRLIIDDDDFDWPDDQIELLWELEDEEFAWLWEYTAAHGLKLQWTDDEIYQPRMIDGELRSCRILTSVRADDE
jgi:hypothetical protein